METTTVYSGNIRVILGEWKRKWKLLLQNLQALASHAACYEGAALFLANCVQEPLAAEEGLF